MVEPLKDSPTPLSRNAPCPCGSGKRYKDCHGSLGANPEHRLGATLQQSRRALLFEALAAQRAGRLDEAHAKYEAVVRDEPDNFDALHMLGVVCMQLNRLDRAEALVSRALTVRTEAAAQYNLDLIRQCRQLDTRERGLCRGVLPRLAHLASPASEVASWLRSPRGVAHLVIADDEVMPDLIERISRLWPVSTFRRTWLAAPRLASCPGELEIEAGPFGSPACAADDLVIVVGTKMSLGEWTLGTAPALRVLLITRDEPCELIDRLRQLSGDGRTGVVPCFVSAELRDACALAGPVLEDLSASHADVALTKAVAQPRPTIPATGIATGTWTPPVRLIAFYLPQYHPTPENDRWWGPGFTEWTNVRRGEPQFTGHYQPHAPGELGYYDLRDASVRVAQAALARSHGLHGFCYYFYWFNGKRLLDAPLNHMLASGTPDFPFCVCWANENWTRRWDGLEHEVLMEQTYGDADAEALMRALLPLFRDPRYIRVDGRPLLLVYKAHLIPGLVALAAIWRRIAAEQADTEIYLCACETGDVIDPRSYGFDATVEFPPHRHHALRLNARLPGLRPDFTGIVTSYRSQIIQALDRRPESFPVFRTVMPSWDNTARRRTNGTIFAGSSPELFGHWTEAVVAETCTRFDGDRRIVFINAWNEWGEGCHLEPDQRFGRQYLEALRDTLGARFDTHLSPPQTVAAASRTWPRARRT